jgi:hypothetical protein
MDCIEPVYTAFLRGGPGLEPPDPIYYNNTKHYILYKNVMILTQYVNPSREYSTVTPYINLVPPSLRGPATAMLANS